MAHHTRIRATGFWILASTFDPAEAEALDLAQFGSIDGDTGGTWAPSAVITIGGQGLTVGGAFNASDVRTAVWQSGGSATWDAGASALFRGVGSTCLFDTSAELAIAHDGEFTLNRLGDYLLRAYNPGSGQQLRLYGDLFAHDGARVTLESGSTMTVEAGTALSIDCSTTMGGNSTFGYQDGHASTFQGGTTVTFQDSSDLVAQDGARVSFQSGSTFANGADETRTGPLTLSGDGATTKLRVKTLSIVADDTIDVSADLWVVPGALSTAKTYTVDVAGASEGMPLRVVHSEATGVGLTGQFYLTSSLGTVLFLCGLGYHAFVDLVFRSGDWTLADAKLYHNGSLSGTGLYGN